MSLASTSPGVLQSRLRIHHRIFDPWRNNNVDGQTCLGEFGFDHQFPKEADDVGQRTLVYVYI